MNIGQVLYYTLYTIHYTLYIIHYTLQVLSEQESKENREEDDVRGRMLAAQQQSAEKTKLISELRDELSDIVRNKSLQVRISGQYWSILVNNGQ